MIRAFSLTAALFSMMPLPAGAQPDSDDAATAMFAATFRETCFSGFEEDGTPLAPERYEVSLAEAQADAGLTAVLWQFRCQFFAYNIADVFLLALPGEEIVPVALPRPLLLIEYEEETIGPGYADSILARMEINGWKADLFPINPVFDPKRREITAHTYWLSQGDASDTGIWRLEPDGFRLIRYDVDPTHDGEVNPMNLISFE